MRLTLNSHLKQRRKDQRSDCSVNCKVLRPACRISYLVRSTLRSNFTSVPNLEFWSVMKNLLCSKRICAWTRETEISVMRISHW